MTYIVFFNKTGNRKLAIEIDGKMLVSDIDEKLASFINSVCERNDYTFSFYNDNTDILKNLPIVNANIL